METENQKLVVRLRELCQAVVAHDMSQFTMSIPAEPDRDADLVLAVAAMRIEELAVENAALTTILEAAKKDAERYRALRGRATTDPFKSPWVVIAVRDPLIGTKIISGRGLDVVVDEAIAATTRSKS